MSHDTCTRPTGSSVPSRRDRSGATVRELIMELAQIEDAIRHRPARGGWAVPEDPALVEQQRAVVTALRSRRVVDLGRHGGRGTGPVVDGDRS